MSFMKYLVIVETTANGYSAYAPDLPGCVAAADTRRDVVELMREAISVYIGELRAAGESVPAPVSQSELVDVHAA